MISRPTVLILGAGASAHCGYPLGADLLSRLCRRRPWPSDQPLPNAWTTEQVDQLLLRLSRSAHYSIDAFLESVPKYAPLGKYLIAQELKKHESLDRLFPPNSSGWYQYLFNQLLVDGRPEFEKNQIGIITFNYDRSLEAYLYTVLQHRFQLGPAGASEQLARLRLIHVHGILGAFPDTPYTAEADSAEILRISKQIQVIHEIHDDGCGFCNDAFRDSNEMLQDAQRVFFLGFGFHPDNLRRFQFFRPDNTRGREIRSTTIGMETLEPEKRSKDLAEYGITIDVFPRNSANCERFFGRTAFLE